MNLLKNTSLIDLVPSECCLSQNYPNPFNEKTTIKFCVAYRTRVRLEVFNAEGTIVRTLLDEEKDAGTYEIEFSAAGDVCEMPEGLYLYRLQAGNFVQSKKLVLLK